LNRGVLHKDIHDLLVWGGDPKGVFTVKSAYALLDCQSNGTMDGVFSLLWQAKAFPKVLIPAWRILLARLPTTHNLIRRGVVVNSLLCVLCS